MITQIHAKITTFCRKDYQNRKVKKYYLNLCSHHKGKFIKHTQSHHIVVTEDDSLCDCTAPV